MSKIIDFKDKVSKENSDQDIVERILQCAEKKYNGEKCECSYCNYKKGATEMVVDLLANDVYNYTQNNKSAKITFFDLKEIFADAILKIIELEEEHMKEIEKDV